MAERARGSFDYGLNFSVWIVGILALAGISAADAQRPEPGARDFSGVWFPAGFSQPRPNPPPFTAAAQTLAEQFSAQFETDDDPGLYCIWPGMPRAPWGAPFAIEIFHNAHDLTIIWEGYGMYRKVFMAEHDPPEPVMPTAMGHSIARWEGDVLVIETTHLRPYPYMNRFPTSSDAHVVERLWLEEREVNGRMQKYLVDEITLTDPRLYTEPVRWRADAVHRPDFHLLEYTCSVSLWEAYLDQRGLSLPDVDALPPASMP
jgi:hypothetical protein